MDQGSSSHGDRKRRRHHHSSRHRSRSRDDKHSDRSDRDRHHHHHHRRSSSSSKGHHKTHRKHGDDDDGGDDDNHRRRHKRHHSSSRHRSSSHRRSSSSPDHHGPTSSSSTAFSSASSISTTTVVPTQPNSNSNSNSVHGSIERRQHNHTSITSAVQNDPVPLPPLPLDPNGKTLAQNIQSGRSMISTTATAVAAPPTRPPDEAYFDQLLPSTEHTNALGDVTTLVEQPPEEKHVPSFSLSGALAQDETTGNMINGVVLKYSEPVEARLPTRMYRVYVFKNGKQVDVYHIHRQSFFLFGRDRTVVHVPVDHPSSSSQHAVIQYRFVNGHVKPYIIDIESTNGTLLNGKKIESARYYELKETDMIQFGTSVREYVLVDAGEKKDE